MAASLGPSWSLRSNASPRCLTAYVTPTKNSDGASSSSSAVGGSGGGSGGMIGDSSNPFDDDASSLSSHHTGQHRHAQQQHNNAGYFYSVAFGTERGSLHYRNYPPTSLDSDGGGRNDNVGAGSRSRSGSYQYHEHQSRGNRDPSQVFVDPDPSPDGQINLQGAVKGSIVGIVRARPRSEESSTATTTLSTPATPVFLLLVDDNRGSSSAQSSNPGAYAAHLVTVRHGAFNKLPAAPAALEGNSGAMPSPDNSSRPPLSSSNNHRRGGSAASGGSFSGGSSWFGGGGGSHTPGSGGNTKSTSQQYASPQNNAGSGNNASNLSLGALPRMSCATYHPNAGFVYAAGTGVYGLPNAAVRAVLAGMAASSGDLQQSASSSSIRQRHTTATTTASSFATQQQSKHHIQSPTALFLKTNHSLPMPGARCSSSGGCGSKNGMTLACNGRAAIVAVTNAFYAVPAFLDVNAIRSLLSGGSSSAGGGMHRSGGPSSTSTTSLASLPSVRATKIVTFAQSSQVHPVIAVEVMTSSSFMDILPSGSGAGTASNIAKYLRPITSLVFLASGRECTTAEIASVPDAKAVSMMAKGGSVVGGMVSTSIKSSAQKHGMATLPSPILAAAALPPTMDGISGRGNMSGRRGDLSSGPLVALLTADGLVHIRSPSCVAVPLASIEVGTRPNDFFSLSSLPCPRINFQSRNVVATSYGGEARLVSAHVETPQDFADRLIKLSIDAFGPNGFPRLELAEATGATFSATSYSGGTPESTALGRGLLRQYLESVLGLDDGIRAIGGAPGSSEAKHGLIKAEGNEFREDDNTPSSSSSLSPNALLTCTALLCLVCHQLNPPNGTAACRASKACASAMGTVPTNSNMISKAAVAVCELVADRLLKEASASSFSLLTTSSSVSAPSGGGGRHPSSLSQGAGVSMEFVESAIWLLRSCGCHEKAIDVLQERMNSPAFRNASVGISASSSNVSSTGSSGLGGGTGNIGTGGGWSQIKFDSYLATHLGELWSSRDDRCRHLVLHSPATRELASRNPTLGLSVFTNSHPRNEAEWRKTRPENDPLVDPMYPPRVVELLKSVTPQHMSSSGTGAHELGMAESFSSGFGGGRGGQGAGSSLEGPLPLDSGRALAVSYLESAIGLATGRPTSSESSSSAGGATAADVNLSFQPESPRDEADERKADMHDELSYLLLEGVISERGADDQYNNRAGVEEDSDLGKMYRHRLRRLLGWPGSKIRSERLLGSLPSSFLREHALLLGRLGRHEDALRILYSKENSLELALEYCDVRHERQQAARRLEEGKESRSSSEECAYIPLVRVALTSDPDSDRGTAAAIRVLALRRDSIDKSAALRLLPKNIPMSSVVRPFLIPAVVENESELRRLTMASSLLRSRYVQLKKKLTEAQLKSQATLHGAPALQRLNLGEPLHSSKPIKARPVHATSPYYPDVVLIKHFFPRHLVIQARVTNNSNVSGHEGGGAEPRTLSNVAFVIAESSDEALVPTTELPLKTIPPEAVGSVWCVLAASPQRLDGAAFLACELRFSVLEVDAATGAPLNFGNDGAMPSGADSALTGFGRTYVEELQDIEVRHSEFG